MIEKGGEVMEVYIEVTYFINLLIILLSFEILCFLLNIQMLAKNLFIYCLIYNISFILLYIDIFDGFLFLYFLLVTFIFFRKRTYLYYPIFMFIYISILSFLEFVMPHSFIFNGILLVENIGISSIVVVGFIGIVIVYFYICYCQKMIHCSDVMISLDDHLYRAIVDSGNQTWYKGYPLIFISDQLVKYYDVVDCIYVSTAYRKEKIEIVLIKKIDINFETFYNVYAGKMSLNEYDCILNTYLLGGVL